MGVASRQRPVRRAVRVKTVVRLLRPLSDDQVSSLLGSLRCWRDRALMLLVLHEGLRPGEALSLHLEDVMDERSTRLYTRVSDRVVVAEYQRALGLDLLP